MSKQRIHKAAGQGDLKALQEELDKGVSVDFAGYGYQTPLHYAARARNNFEAVKFLIERKATVDKVNYQGSSALHRACFYGHPEIAAFLLDNGADINKLDNDGETPLMRAVDGEAAKCVKLLLERKADMTVKGIRNDYRGKTALDLAKDGTVDEIVSLLEFASTAAPPPAPPAPRVELEPTAGSPSVADKADNKSSAKSNSKA